MTSRSIVAVASVVLAVSPDDVVLGPLVARAGSELGLPQLLDRSNANTNWQDRLIVRTGRVLVGWNLVARLG
jgi:hypothetical protein